MPLLKDIDDRAKRAEQLREGANPLLQQLETDITNAVLDFATELATKDGRLVYSVKAAFKVNDLLKIFSGWGKRFKQIVLKYVLEGFEELLGLNDKFAKIQVPTRRDIQTLARERVLLRWGYDASTGNLLPGSYFEKLFSTQQMAAQVAGFVNRAMGLKMSLAEFRRRFRQLFVPGRFGPGILQRHWKTNTFDLFQRLDRAIQLEYANELGLNFAIYSGTIIETSREFCIARTGKVFSREQIAGWATLNFSGKPKLYEPFTDCGGHNCRHHLSFVSDTVAEFLLKKQK